MNLPLISILTPFKNTAQYLDDCINSIINQSYQNWELILVDDFSTDKTLDVINSFLYFGFAARAINSLYRFITYSNLIFN